MKRTILFLLFLPAILTAQEDWNDFRLKPSREIISQSTRFDTSYLAIYIGGNFVNVINGIDGLGWQTSPDMTLSALIDSIGTDTATVTINWRIPFGVTNRDTIPSNITLNFLGNGGLTIDRFTTIYGSIIAGEYQRIFYGSTDSLDIKQKVNGLWFGKTLSAFNYAIRSIVDSGTVYIPAGHYDMVDELWHNNIVIKSGVSFEGDNQNTVLDFSGNDDTDTTGCIYADGASNFAIRGFHIISNGGRVIDINALTADATNITVEKNRITSPGRVAGIYCAGILAVAHNIYSINYLDILDNVVQADHLGILVKNDGSTGKIRTVEIDGNIVKTSPDGWYPDLIKVDGQNGILRYCIVSNNFVDNSEYLGTDEEHGITVDDNARYVIVNGNIVHHFNSTTASSGILVESVNGGSTGGRNINIVNNNLFENYSHIETDTLGGGSLPTRTMDNIFISGNSFDAASYLDVHDRLDAHRFIQNFAKGKQEINKTLLTDSLVISVDDTVRAQFTVEDTTDNSGVAALDYKGGVYIGNIGENPGNYAQLSMAAFSDNDRRYIRAIGNGNNDVDLSLGRQYSIDSDYIDQFRILSSGAIKVANGSARIVFTDTDVNHVSNTISTAADTAAIDINVSGSQPYISFANAAGQIWKIQLFTKSSADSLIVTNSVTTDTTWLNPER